jgi:hypothetical protein
MKIVLRDGSSVIFIDTYVFLLESVMLIDMCDQNKHLRKMKHVATVILFLFVVRP